MTGHFVAVSVRRETEGSLAEVEVAKVRSVVVLVRPRKGQTVLNFAREESLSMVLRGGLQKFGCPELYIKRAAAGNSHVPIGWSQNHLLISPSIQSASTKLRDPRRAGSHTDTYNAPCAFHGTFMACSPIFDSRLNHGRAVQLVEN